MPVGRRSLRSATTGALAYWEEPGRRGPGRATIEGMTLHSLARWLPFLKWPRPDRQLLKGEFWAGMTVGLMLVPQGVAYAALAGMPLVTGIYASLIPALVAVLFSSSTRLGVGPTALTSLLIGASLTSYDTASSTLNSASAIAKAEAINKVSAQTGVTATAKNELSGSSMTGAAAAGTITINGVTTDSFSTVGDAAKDRAAVVAAINKISGRTGVTASDGGSDSLGVKLTASDGRNIVLSFGTHTAASTGLSAAGTYVGRVTLSSAGQIDVDLGTSGTGTDNFGIDAGVYGSGKSGQALDLVDITTVAGANTAITAIDNALAQVNAARGELGAVQNRFNATVANLQTQAESLTASRSRIQDADFAAETSQLTRAQILQQAGVAMLAQANALPQQVLTLLQG